VGEFPIKGDGMEKGEPKFAILEGEVSWLEALGKIPRTLRQDVIDENRRDFFKGSGGNRKMWHLQ